MSSARRSPRRAAARVAAAPTRSPSPTSSPRSRPARSSCTTTTRPAPARRRTRCGSRSRWRRLEPALERGQRLVQPGGVAPGAEQLERPGLAVEARLGAADQLVAYEQRQHVVAELALRPRDVHLQAVAEVPERLGAGAVVDQAVERREQDRAVGHRLVAHVRVRDPFALLAPDAERAEPPRLQLALGLAPAQRLRLGVDALTEIPEPLRADAACDGDLAARGQDLQHQPHLAVAPPAVLLAARHQVVFAVAREQRSVALELAQHMAAEACVRAEEVAHPLVALQLPAAPTPRHA